MLLIVGDACAVFWWTSLGKVEENHVGGLSVRLNWLVTIDVSEVSPSAGKMWTSQAWRGSCGSGSNAVMVDDIVV